MHGIFYTSYSSCGVIMSLDMYNKCNINHHDCDLAMYYLFQDRETV